MAVQVVKMQNTEQCTSMIVNVDLYLLLVIALATEVTLGIYYAVSRAGGSRDVSLLRIYNVWQERVLYSTLVRDLLVRHVLPYHFLDISKNSQ